MAIFDITYVGDMPYLKLEGGTVTGATTFTNNIAASTINGVTVGSNPKFTDTTYSVATTSASGLLPALGGGTTNYLRADGSWATPVGTTYSVATTSANGLMAAADKVAVNKIGSGTLNTTNQTIIPAINELVADSSVKFDKIILKPTGVNYYILPTTGITSVKGYFQLIKEDMDIYYSQFTKTSTSSSTTASMSGGLLSDTAPLVLNTLSTKIPINISFSYNFTGGYSTYSSASDSSLDQNTIYLYNSDYSPTHLIFSNTACGVTSNGKTNVISTRSHASVLMYYLVNPYTSSEPTVYPVRAGSHGIGGHSQTEIAMYIAYI